MSGQGATRTLPRQRVLVTLPLFDEVIDRLSASFDVDVSREGILAEPEALARRAAGCAGLLVSGSPRIDAALLDACPGLRAVCSMAVGFNNIDVDACTARGVLVSNAPGVLTETTADFGFALMMAAARRVTESEHYLRAGRWNTWRYDMFAGQDVHGSTLGILGMGRIGQAIARRGALGFGMPVIYHNRSRLDPAAEAVVSARWVDKPTLFAEADHIVVVVPYTPQAHHMVGEAELGLMKRTATLTNIARGGVVDDAALARALGEGRIAAAALDVFEGEPQVHPGLLAATHVVLTPHIASASLRTRRAMADLAASNLEAALGVGPNPGRPPTALNPQVLAARPG